MVEFSAYFCPEQIIRVLCKYRVKYATNRHGLHLLSDVSSSASSLREFKSKAPIPKDFSALMPPRRQWYKPTSLERNKFRNPQKRQAFAIYKTIELIRRRISPPATKSPWHVRLFKFVLLLFAWPGINMLAQGGLNFISAEPTWYISLNQFIYQLHRRVENIDVGEIKPPKILPIKKEDKKTCKECRPISIYLDLEDRVIISLTAKYLTDLFDEYFQECALAFRSVSPSGKSQTRRTHHDAIGKIEEYRMRNLGRAIYVSECDIQKFFDCVNHDLALECFDEFSKSHKIAVDHRARQVFKQYLRSYSFSHTIYPLNDGTFFSDCGMSGSSFKWVDADLNGHFYEEGGTSTLSNFHIGIPQGGAISCFISNLFLHSVDTAVIGDGSDPDLLYMRFCDDMIILHTDKQKCENALDRYQKAISKLKLLVHEPVDVHHYSKAFWGFKSKRPYKWARKDKDGSSVPWLSFVGYNVKFDGAIRIRKKSLKKELRKQKEECDRVIRALNDGDLPLNTNSKKSRRQQLFALENRLISMSVGRVKLYQKQGDSSLCWTTGFRALNDSSTARRQLRILDSHRSKQIRRTKRSLAQLTIPTTNAEYKKIRRLYFGAPFSYYRFVENKFKYSK